MKNRLEEIRQAIKEENVSIGELLELQSLVEYIDEGDVELLEWAGVDEEIMEKFARRCDVTDNEIKEQIFDVADRLLGISDDWDYFDIEQFLDWQLDNLDDLPKGYPKEVMDIKYGVQIMDAVEELLSKRNK